MMKNTLGDLNNHLFEQLERLNDEDIKGEDLTQEIQRAKAITGIASQIIQGGNLVLRAQEMVNNSLSAGAKVPKMLEAGDD